MKTDDFGVRRVVAVETEYGTVQTPCVVNCAGTGNAVEKDSCKFISLKLRTLVTIRLYNLPRLMQKSVNVCGHTYDPIQFVHKIWRGLQYMKKVFWIS